MNICELARAPADCKSCTAWLTEMLQVKAQLADTAFFTQPTLSPVVEYLDHDLPLRILTEILALSCPISMP